MFPAALLMHVHVFIQFIECIVFIKDSSCVHKKKKKQLIMQNGK